MSNTYITIVDGEYKKAKAPDVPQPWIPKGGSEGGSGLPDPSSYSDGTVLIKVGDEWKAQEGYGYESEAFAPITWDGNTEGREVVAGVLYKITDDVPNADLTGSVVSVVVDGETASEEASIVELESGVFQLNAYDRQVIVADHTFSMGGIDLTKGVWFLKSSETDYVYALTAPSSVHQIDPKFIGNVEEWTFTLADDTTVTKKIFVVEE